MKSVLAALARALPLLVHPRVLMLVLVPLLLAAVALVLLAAFAWAPLAHALAGLFGEYAQSTLVSAIAGVLALVILTLGVGVAALAAIAIFAGPVFVRVVADSHFPALERKRGGTVAGSTINALVALAIALPLWLVSLPLWFLPLAGGAASILISAWLNQRLFRYDALAEHASAAERERIIRDARWRLFGMGLALAPLALVPVANLVMPVLAGLAFTALCLGELAALRATVPKAAS